MKIRLIPLALLLVLWATRVWALESLPLHNDEGLHLTRAVEVWNGHPFWDISDGKIVNHWLIAAFYPQNAPVFAGRVATIFVSLIGLAAGCALARRAWGAALAGLLWITSPYLFFYERLAFSDAEAGALVVVAVWLAARLGRSGRGAVLTGLAMGAAALFKFTAMPFALTVAIIVVFNSPFSLKRRFLLLGIAALTAAFCFVPPLAYLALRGKDFFAVALDWVGVSSGQGDPAFAANVARLWAQLTGYGTLAWTTLLLGGLVCLLMFSRQGRILLLAASLPLVIMLVLGREVLPRHFVVALPIMLTLAGIGLGALIERLDEARERWPLAGLAAVTLILGLLPFAQTAYTSPGDLTLPGEDTHQFIIDHSAGFGLREAVLSFPGVTENALSIIASMFPDGCKRANFYAAPEFKMRCPAAPGVDAINEALNEHGAVYVLVD
ncbi:MAG: hypothetical protein K8I30_22210, partial [Anaerolineae bacterium]|nr:hypothetical protein [Anaerolineae bacterium]